MIAPDSSVVIAAIAPWHVAHGPARDALAGSETGLVAHVAYESSSALSRMPEGRRIAATRVLEALELNFPTEWLTLDGTQARAALAGAVSSGVRGGALYDALIAATAQRNGAHLLTADRRAAPVYEAVGVVVEYLPG
ncbi:MAG: PIN domain-containing protein [Thermoleophilaceae bacterium]